MPEPYFGWHVNLIHMAGLIPRFLRLEGGSLTRAAASAACGPRTRGIVLCTPANPSGAMYSVADLEAVADIARQQDLWVVTDEQYEHFCYDGNRHVSPASVSDLGERTVTIMGFSKTLSVTGWRLGYAVAPKELLDPIASAHQLMYICPPTPLQHGVAAAMRSLSELCREQCSELQEKRDQLCAALVDAGFDVALPQGGFFILTNTAPLGCARAADAAMALLERVGVAAVPGTDFYSGASGESALRFCFAKSDREIEEGCRRLRTLQS